MDERHELSAGRTTGTWTATDQPWSSVDAGRAIGQTTQPKFLYRELRSLASRLLARRGREQKDRTLCTTALVHEAFLKLAAQQDISFADRSHFLAYFARAMRSVVVDEARRRQTQRKGGGWQRVQWSDEFEGSGTAPEHLIALDQALERLAAVDQRLSDIAELRIFGGLGQNECSQALGVSQRTAARFWRKARAMLGSEMVVSDPE